MGRTIRTGVLKKRTKEGIENMNYHMRLLELYHLPEILNLQEVVVNKLDSKDIFQSDNKDFFIDELSKGGKIIGVFSEESNKNKLVAYRFITFPKGESMNLGNDLQLPSEELDKVGHLETTIVHPNYRGNRLQKKTLFVALDLFEDLGYNHICSTISPKNFYSLYNVMSGGLVIKRLKEKYGGKLRFILHKDLHDRRIREYCRTISIDDVNIVKREGILEKGFEGYQALRKNINYEIKYGAIC